MPDMLNATNLQQVFNEFLDQLPGQSASNRYNYHRRLKPFFDQYKDKTLAQITRADVNIYIAGLTARGYAEATMTGYRQSVKGFFNFCVRQGYLAISPASHIKTGKFVSRRRKLPPEKDVKAITQLAEQWLQGYHPRKVRDAVIWLMCLTSGPRQREIGELRKSEVEYAFRLGPDSQGIYRCVSVGKTKEILIRFDEVVAQGLRKWLDLRPQCTLDRCFITISPRTTTTDPVASYRGLSRNATTHIFEQLAKEAGVAKPIFTHALRHRRGTKTTREHNAKLAAMILNHRDWHSAKTAMEFYYHPDEESVSAVLANESQSELEGMRRLFGLVK